MHRKLSIIFVTLLMSLSLTSCYTRTIYVPTAPIPCRISPFPRPPEPPSWLLPCEIEGVERVCIDKDYFNNIGTWLKQINRWRNEVRTCKGVREADITLSDLPSKGVEYAANKLMESF